MKRKIILSSIIGILCFALWFLPISAPSDHVKWVSSISLFLANLFDGFNIAFLREAFIIILGCIVIIFAIINALKNSRIFLHILTPAVSLYIILWMLTIFAPIFSNRSTILQSCEFGLSRVWIGLYILILFAIITLLILQYLPPRRPTKAERLEAKIDELQKQVDELKKGE